MPATRPAKRQKRNAVEAIDSAGAGAGKKPPFLPRKRGELKAAAKCDALSALSLRSKRNLSSWSQRNHGSNVWSCAGFRSLPRRSNHPARRPAKVTPSMKIAAGAAGIIEEVMAREPHLGRGRRGGSPRTPVGIGKTHLHVGPPFVSDEAWLSGVRKHLRERIIVGHDLAMMPTCALQKVGGYSWGTSDVPVLLSAQPFLTRRCHWPELGQSRSPLADDFCHSGSHQR
jgi:hypothetical protein